VESQQWSLRLLDGWFLPSQVVLLGRRFSLGVFFAFVRVACFGVALECRVQVLASVALRSMWTCCLCGFGPVIVGFRPVFS
jgi:hypothetical protein